MTKPTQSGTKRKIIIPELEEIRRNVRPVTFWTEKEIEIIKEYYGTIPTKDLANYLGKTKDSVSTKAANLGLSFKKGSGQ